jgi:hypothetical protein
MAGTAPRYRERDAEPPRPLRPHVGVVQQREDHVVAWAQR